MSTGRSDALDALPRASLLTYFRHPTPTPRPQRRISRHYERPPPPYNPSSTTRSPLLPRISESEREDADAQVNEESQLGFWGERSSTSKDEVNHEDEERVHDDEKCGGCQWEFFEVLTLVCYALLVLVIVLNLDAFLSRMGVGSGMVDWNGYSIASEGARELQFCLDSSDRDAPASRVWRYTAPTSLDECTTQLVTLSADATEGWKLLPDDKVLWKDEKASQKASHDKRKFIPQKWGGGKCSKREHNCGDEPAA